MTFQAQVPLLLLKKLQFGHGTAAVDD